MKIGIVGTDVFSAGKANIIDPRVKTLKEMFASPKEVYIQAEIITDQAKLFECDGILAPESAKLDLIVHEIEFVETRLARASEEKEKTLLSKFKDQLDKEGLICELPLNEEERLAAAAYSMLSVRPVHLAGPEAFEKKEQVLFEAYYKSGFISFFTAGDKDSHAWSIRKGANAYEAAGAIHTDIQRGFIRAEVINCKDLFADGSLSRARSNNHIRLEMKEYIVQDGDYLVIRTNK
jgi:ribosome-binding ATPase YchF (GTP1/OBG family)